MEHEDSSMILQSKMLNSVPNALQIWLHDTNMQDRR